MPAEGEMLAGRYRVERFIREGSSGPVYLCLDVPMDRTVAVVFLPARLRDEAPERWETRVRRLRTEARAAGRVVHQNLVTAHTLETDTGGDYVLVLAHGDEPTLADVLREGPLEVDRALAIAIGLARAIQVLAAHGIVHRDIKPANPC